MIYAEVSCIAKLSTHYCNVKKMVCPKNFECRAVSGLSGKRGHQWGEFFFYFEIELILSVTLSLTSPTRKYLFNTTIQTLKQRLWMLILGLSFRSLLLTLDWYLHKGLYKKIFCSQILCIKLISKNLQQNPWESFFSQIVYLKACNFTKNDPIKGSSFEFANFP